MEMNGVASCYIYIDMYHIRERELPLDFLKNFGI